MRANFSTLQRASRSLKVQIALKSDFRSENSYRLRGSSNDKSLRMSGKVSNETDGSKVSRSSRQPGTYLKSCRTHGNDIAGLFQSTGSQHLAFRRNHFCSCLPCSFRLRGHGSLQLHRKSNVLSKSETSVTFRSVYPSLCLHR